LKPSKPSLPPNGSVRLVTGWSFERERDRADRMVTTHDRLVTELENLRTLLEDSQQAARPVTPRTWREMTWRERVRWLRTTG
jgi:hypothetical protein